MAIDPRVLDLVRQFETLQEHGPPPSAEELCSDCPELLEEVKRHLEDRLSDKLPPDSADSRTPATLNTAGDVSISSTGQLPEQAGRYSLSGEIARGGMGSVLHAHDDRLNRDLAVKVLHREFCDVPTVVRRFTNEAWIGGQLQHPGIVPVHDLGVLPDGRPFFAMKLVKGQTLASLLRARANPGQDLSRLLTVFEQVCQTIAYAHSRRVIHRDLKPANIMVGAFGEVQVMDWGIAKVLGQSDGSPPPTATEAMVTHVSTDRPDWPGLETRAGAVLGTYAYMAPEQARGQADRLDERCDVFGLGSILCEILTGEPAYVGGSADQLRVMALAAQLSPAMARLEACGADAELLGLARHCLAAEPEDRPRDGAAVAAAMTAYLGGVRDRLRRAELERAAAQVKAAEERKRRRVTLVLASAMLLAILAGGGASLLAQRYKQARKEQTARLVQQALGQATALREQARVAPLDDAALRERAAALWRDTLAAADRAEQALGGGETDTETSRHANELLEELRQEGGESDRDRRMLRRLEEAHDLEEELQESDYVRPRRVEEFVFGLAAAPAFAAAFREYGIDVESLSTAEAAERMRSRRIRLQLATALDDWYFLAPEAAGGRLLDISRAADPDPLRDRVRDAIARKDHQALIQLAASAEAIDLPVPTLTLLADLLHQQGMRSEGLQLMKRARDRHPNDFWVNDVLGLHLQSADPPDYGEAARCFAAAIALRPGSAIGWSNLGTTLTVLGRLDEAVAVLREAIRIKPDFLTSYERLSQALMQKSEEDAALAMLQGPLQLRPESLMLRTILGQILQSQGKLDPAIATFGKVLDSNPRWVPARLALAQALSAAGRKREALEQLEQTERSHPNLHLIHEARGMVLLNHGEKPGALAAYREAVRLSPGSATVWSGLGAALAANGQHEEALRMHHKAIRIAPENAVFHVSLADSLRLMGRMNEAEAEYRLATQLNPRSPWAFNGLGLALFALGQFNDAAQAYRLALALKPREPWIHAYLGSALRSQKDYSPAAAAFGEAIRLKPDESSFHTFLGHVHYDQRRFAESIPHYREASRLKQDDPVLAENLANALWYSGDQTGSLAVLRNAIRRNQMVAHPWERLARLLSEAGKHDEAIGAARKAVELGPRSDAAHFTLALVLGKKGRFDEAISEFREAIRLNPRDAVSHAQLGNVYYNKGQYADALVCHQEMVRLAPGNAVALQVLGNTLSALQRYSEAADAYGRACELEPGNLLYHNDLALALCYQHAYRQAEGIARKAIALDPKRDEGHTALGYIFQEQNRLDEAAAQYRQAIERNPRAVSAHLYLGTVLRAQGKDAEAEASYRKAAMLAPKLAGPSINLAALWLKNGRAAEAEVELRRAAKLEPNSPNPHSLLSKALLDQGKVSEALASVRKALQLQPSNPRILFRLGDALLAHGEFAEALVTLSRANQLRKPEHDRIDPPPWEERLRECRRCLELDAMLKGVRDGKLKVVEPAEQLTLAAFCRERKKQYRFAAQLYSDAFAAAPQLANDLAAGHRFSAARAAAVASRSEEKPPPDAKERLHWRKQALDWLGEDLAEYGKRLQSGKPEERKLILKRLQNWRQDADLNALRDKDSVGQLPADERQACRKLWAEVEALLADAQAKAH
jgi:serine/threonine-protein kinase